MESRDFFKTYRNIHVSKQKVIEDLNRGSEGDEDLRTLLYEHIDVLNEMITRLKSEEAASRLALEQELVE